MNTGTSTSDSRGREYETLRAEILSLQEAASKAWRDGLIELGAVSGILAASVSGLNDDLLKTLQSESSGTAVDIVFLLFCLVGLGIAVLETRTAATEEDGADRIGGFLAVFHDLELEDRPVPPLGWHIWNRIEKASRSHVPIGLTKTILRVLKMPLSLLPSIREREETESSPMPRVTYVQDHFFVYVPVLLAYQAFLFLLAYILLNKILVISGCFGIAVTAVFMMWLYRLRNESRGKARFWTKKWWEIRHNARAPNFLIDNLKEWGIPQQQSTSGGS